MTNRTRPRIDPAVIRTALDMVDSGRSVYAAANTLGVAHRTVTRWVVRRDEREHPDWPTPAEIAAWRVDEEANRDARRRNAAVAYRYRQRVYLNRGRLQVPAVGTTRRLQALAAVGWTQTDIAARLGVSQARVGHLMNGLWPMVFPSTATAVARVFDELCMVVPTDPAPARRGEVRIHERARRQARRRGWMSALAWDEGAIDDPAARPYRPTRDTRPHDDVDASTVERLLTGERVRSTRAEKEEVCRRWLATGRPLAELQRRLGWKPERYVPTTRGEEAS
jgi:transcriptional regulator with XRE-family HTH domain